MSPFDWVAEYIALLDPPIEDDDTPPPAGGSYECQRCDVYGATPREEPMRCWACDQTDRLVRK